MVVYTGEYIGRQRVMVSGTSLKVLNATSSTHEFDFNGYLSGPVQPGRVASFGPVSKGEHVLRCPGRGQIGIKSL